MKTLRTLSLIDNPAEGDFWEWEAPVPDACYVIGVDPAQGRSRTQGDHTCISIWRRFTSRMEQVGEWYGRVEPSIQAELIHSFCLRYRGYESAALLNVERNIAEAIIMGLRDQEFPEEALFIPKPTTSKTMGVDEGRIFFHKHASNEQYLFDSFVGHAEAGDIVMRSMYLWEEVYSLREEQRKRTGTVTVPTGGKDRTVAMLMAMVAHLQTPYQEAPVVIERKVEYPPQGVDPDAWREKHGQSVPVQDDWGDMDGVPDYSESYGMGGD